MVAGVNLLTSCVNEYPLYIFAQHINAIISTRTKIMYTYVLIVLQSTFQQYSTERIQVMQCNVVQQ